MKFLLTIIGTFCLSITLFGNAPTRTGRVATLSGIVVDENGAVIRGVSLEFARGGRNTLSVTTDDGSYRATLEPGTYDFTAHVRDFCPRHRGSILVSENSEIRIDLEMFVGGYGDPTEPGPVLGDPSAPSRASCIYENGLREEQLSPIPATGLRPLVLYGHREEKAGLTLYVGLQRHPTVFTYNLVTLKAASVAYDTKEKSIDGTGNVSWQDGTKTWHGRRIKVSLNEKSPMVVLEE